jgi:hypothetical protein
MIKIEQFARVALWLQPFDKWIQNLTQLTKIVTFHFPFDAKGAQGHLNPGEFCLR